MFACFVLGATGYVGNELLRILHNNSHFSVVGAFSSEGSTVRQWQQVSPATAELNDCEIAPWQDSILDVVECEVVFLALPHEVSARLAPLFAAKDIRVFDLSGAYRFDCPERFANAYGFTHPHPELFGRVPYTYFDSPWEETKEGIYSVPGCYPTASLIALKPIQQAGWLDSKVRPVITATSGVSGAGRSISARTAFCEVSLQAYGVLAHRHEPEIAEQLGCEVTFTPILGAFPRGIMAVCTTELTEAMSTAEVAAYYQEYYADHPLVRVVDEPPAIHHVAGTSLGLVYVRVSQRRLVIISVIDNLLLGAAAQAVFAANRLFGLPPMAGIVSGACAS
ncbi:MAG: N-acetyl-gamma-glutamyl-phosphate reductase [Idiomarina sp.]|nr:N-acetyl-gamma-glutamyl-phosphate reductase [Idiomarina sp.]